MIGHGLKQKKRINKLRWQTYPRANIEHQTLFRQVANRPASTGAL